MSEFTEPQPAGYVNEMGEAILLAALKDDQQRDHHRRIMANVAPIAGLNFLFSFTGQEAQRMAACWSAFGLVPVASITALAKAGGVPALCDRLIEVMVERDAMKGQRDVVAAMLDKALDVVRNVEAEGSSEDDLLRDLLTKGQRAVLEVFAGRIPRTPVELTAGNEHCPKCDGTGRYRFDQCMECVGGGIKLPF